MVRLSLQLFLFVSLTMPVSSANAINFTYADVEEVRPDSWMGGVVVLRVSGTPSGDQACPHPSAPGNYYVIPKTHPTFSELLSVALAAQLADRKVHIQGDGTCISDYEGVRFMTVK